MEENKTGKYLKYAIGEILLVVIGILIALSINNWNEERKTTDFEYQLRSELVVTFQDEIKQMERRLVENYQTKRSCESLADHLNQSLPYHDSLNYHFGKAHRVWDANFRYSAFEKAKLYGLDFLDDDTRSGLSILYEVRMKFHETLIERYSMYYYNTVVPELTNNFESIRFRELSKYGMTPYDYEAISKNHRYINILKSTANMVDQILNIEETIMRLLKTQGERLTAEIDKR